MTKYLTHLSTALLMLLCSICSFAQQTNSQKNADIPNILLIGNSFSESSAKYLGCIAHVYGVKMNIWFVGSPGAVFSSNIEKLNSKTVAYQLSKYDYEANTYVDYGFSAPLSPNTLGYSYYDVLQLYDWDYIFIHQGSSLSASDYETYWGGSDDFMKRWIRAIKDNTKNDTFKMGLIMTWTYPELYDYTTFSEASGISNKEEMYEGIVRNVRRASQEYMFDFIVPCGTAIENAERSEAYSRIADLTHKGDDIHLSVNGSFIASMTIFNEVFAKELNIDIESLDFGKVDTGLRTFLQTAMPFAIEACNDPYKTPVIAQDKQAETPDMLYLNTHLPF